MPRSAFRRTLAFVFISFLVLASLQCFLLWAATIPNRFPQGSQHGFLSLLTQDGKRIATGDVTQSVRGDVVTSRLTFHFHDGSIDDDVTLFSQRGVLRLLSDHHIQKGPSFPKPSDILIDAVHGQVTSRDEKGQVRVEHMDLPTDLANGLPPNLLLNVLPSDPETDISYLLPTTKPRVVRVTIKPAGMVPFTIGGTRRIALKRANRALLALW